MIVIVQGPPASGKSTFARTVSARFGLPHISRDLIQEWLSVVDTENDTRIQKFCSHAGYELMFKLAGELSKGAGGFVVEGCMNPETGPGRMKAALSPGHHRIVEVFLFASHEILVQRYLDRAGSETRHGAHGDESTRGEELAQHLKAVTYTPMRIGDLVLEVDNGDDIEGTTDQLIKELEAFSRLPCTR
jgi:cytidylate kinase